MTNSHITPLLAKNPNIYTVFTGFNDIVDLKEVIKKCDQQEANLWLSSEINFTHDSNDWFKLNEGEKNYLKQILGFFAASDGLVNENLALNFSSLVQIPEVRYFYYFQMMMEAVHQKTYTQMINTFIESKEERQALYNSINEDSQFKTIKKKADWAKKWIHDRLLIDFKTVQDLESVDSEQSLSLQKQFFKTLVAFSAVEGIFFCSSFAGIFWIRDRGILANSLGVANELISRDETLHGEFAALLVNSFGREFISDQEIVEILLEAAAIEKEFVDEVLPDRLFGMNQDLMKQYVEFVTDVWLKEYNIEPHFNASQPFPFMATIGQKRKDLFFEKTRTNYARATVTQDLDFDNIF